VGSIRGRVVSVDGHSDKINRKNNNPSAHEDLKDNSYLEDKDDSVYLDNGWEFDEDDNEDNDNEDND